MSNGGPNVSDWWYKYLSPDGFDPWVAPKGSKTANHLRAYCQVIIAGVDITDRLNPHLISVHIVDEQMAQCTIEIDDRDGKMPIPPLHSPIQIMLGWSSDGMFEVFQGILDDTEYGVGRQEGGRRMWVHGHGADLLLTIKCPMQYNTGTGPPPGQTEGPHVPFGAFIEGSAALAGAFVAVHPFFAGMGRDWWSQDNQSFMDTLQRYADELGGFVRITSGNSAEFTFVGSSPGGGQNPIVPVTWGDNLIGCRIRPFASRGVYKYHTQMWYDVPSKLYQRTEIDSEFAPPGTTAGYQLPQQAPNPTVAFQQAQGSAIKASVHSGNGRIVMDGAPLARWNNLIDLQGVRNGVDGIYRIASADHVYSRQGYITNCEVEVLRDASFILNQLKIPRDKLVATPKPLTIPEPAPNVGP